MMNDHISEGHHRSIGFEDDVFYDHVPSIQGSISRSNFWNKIQDPILHKHNEKNDDYQGDRMLNNKINCLSQRGSQSSNEYVLYYGKSNDFNKYFDRNDLYSSVR